MDCLALTHLDALRVLPDYRYCHAYSGIESLPLPLDVDQQKALTARLLAARPLYRQLADSASVEALCEVVARHSTGGVRFTSSGPSANDVVSVERGSTSSLGR